MPFHSATFAWICILFWRNHVVVPVASRTKSMAICCTVLDKFQFLQKIDRIFSDDREMWSKRLPWKFGCYFLIFAAQITLQVGPIGKLGKVSPSQEPLFDCVEKCVGEEQTNKTSQQVQPDLRSTPAAKITCQVMICSEPRVVFFCVGIENRFISIYKQFLPHHFGESRIQFENVVSI